MDEEMPGLDQYSTPPKLTFDSFPSFLRRTELPEVTTPPIRLPGAVPFRWEEAPGRPIQKSGTASVIVDVDANRQLDLPPRLSASTSTKRGVKNACPTAVIDGPYFFIWKPWSFTSGKQAPLGKEWKGKKVRWNTSTEKSSEDAPNSSASSLTSCKSFSSAGSGCSFYSNGGVGSESGEDESKDHVIDEGEEEERKMRILRYKRKRTVTCVASYTPSHLWAAIYERLKQAVVSHRRDPNV